jgi:hypothetical protein
VNAEIFGRATQATITIPLQATEPFTIKSVIYNPEFREIIIEGDFKAPDANPPSNPAGSSAGASINRNIGIPILDNRDPALIYQNETITGGVFDLDGASHRLVLDAIDKIGKPDGGK